MSDARYSGMNLLRCIAIFLVILSHVSARLLGDFAPAWNAANLYDSLARCSVPIFFMISGFFLLDKKESIKAFYGKRLVKIMPPFLLASIAYAIYKGLDWQSFPVRLLRGDVFFVLWFVYALLGIYLVLPLVRCVIERISRTTLHILLGIWGIIFLFYPLMRNVQDMRSQGFEAWNLYFITGYLGYVVLGYALKHIHIQKYGVWFSIYIINSMLIFLSTYLASHHFGKLIELFYDFLTPFVCFQAVSLFLLCKDIQTNSILLQTISACSYWIYLNHMFTLYFFYYVLKLHAQNHSFLTIPLLTVVGFIISFAWAYWLWKGEQALWKRIRRAS